MLRRLQPRSDGRGNLSLRRSHRSRSSSSNLLRFLLQLRQLLLLLLWPWLSPRLSALLAAIYVTSSTGRPHIGAMRRAVNDQRRHVQRPLQG